MFVQYAHIHVCMYILCIIIIIIIIIIVVVVVVIIFIITYVFFLADLCTYSTTKRRHMGKWKVSACMCTSVM